MTSDQLYVWTWLPGHREPVVAGRVDRVGSRHTFTYGLRYRSRPDSISLYGRSPSGPGRRNPQQVSASRGRCETQAPIGGVAASSSAGEVLRRTR